jgi:sugar phosphate isomerase/epimerase
MQLGAVTYNVLKDWDLDQIIRTLGELGYAAVELRTEHKHGVEPSLNAAERAAVQAKFGASRVRLLSFGTTCEFESPDPQVRARNVETAKQFIDLAHDTGALAIKVRPNGLPAGVPQETTVRNIGESLAQVGDARPSPRPSCAPPRTATSVSAGTRIPPTSSTEAYDPASNCCARGSAIATSTN